MNETEKGSYKIVLVKGDNEKILGVFESKSDAEKYAKENGKNYPRSAGLVCLIRQGDDSKRKEFFGILN